MWSQALSDSETASTQVRHARQRQSGTLLVPPPRSLLGSLRSSRPASLASRVALSATLPRRPASAAPQRPSPAEPATAPLSLQPALTPAPDEAAALAQGAPLPAVIDGRYRVEERIGAGGMCLVYRAWQVFLGQARALKVLRDPSLAEERSRLLREARVGARVQHPNLVRVLDYGVLADGQPYLVMEHLDGITLRRELGGWCFSQEGDRQAGAGWVGCGHVAGPSPQTPGSVPVQHRVLRRPNRSDIDL